MQERRALFSLAYDTAVDKLTILPSLIKDIIEDTPKTTFGRAHFNAFGTYSLNFEIVYYVLSGDYTEYLDIHQSVLLRIMEMLENNGISFAYPTQTLNVNNTLSPASDKNS